MVFTKVARPLNNIYSTQSIEVPPYENGAENDASASENEIPISPCLIALQSLAPSPIMPTQNPAF